MNTLFSTARRARTLMVTALAVMVLTATALLVIADPVDSQPVAGDGGSLPVDWVPPVRSLVPPVTGPVVDPFRPGAGLFGPGNRGLEFSAQPGSLVVAVQSGVVRFAGNVAGRGVVSIRHSARTVTTYSYLVVGSQRPTPLAAGVSVSAGEALGGAQPGFHFGVLVDGSHVDPAPLLRSEGGIPRLVGGSGPPVALLGHGPRIGDVGRPLFGNVRFASIPQMGHSVRMQPDLVGFG